MAKIYTSGEWVSYTPKIAAPILSSTPLYGFGDDVDTLDLSTGSCTRKIVVLEFDGTENWETGGGDGDSAFFKINLSDYKLSTDAACSHWPYTNVTQTGTDVGFYITRSGGNIRIRPANVATTSLADFKAYLAAQATNNTPVTAYYVTTTPTTSTVTVPAGLSGIVEGFLEQATTPTPTNPVYPTGNTVSVFSDTKADKEYTNGSWQ